MPSPFGAISSLTPKAGAGDQQVLVSVPSRGYLFLNSIKKLEREGYVVFPSPLEVISPLTDGNVAINTCVDTGFRPLSGVSLP